jgi:hypothetical protein
MRFSSNESMETRVGRQLIHLTFRTGLAFAVRLVLPVQSNVILDRALLTTMRSFSPSPSSPPRATGHLIVCGKIPFPAKPKTFVTVSAAPRRQANQNEGKVRPAKFLAA